MVTGYMHVPVSSVRVLFPEEPTPPREGGIIEVMGFGVNVIIIITYLV